MNILNVQSTSFTDTFNNWVDSRPLSQIIEEVTYDQYESSNPFRNKFDENQIKTNSIRTTANTALAINAEVFSAFANPYYLGHKIIHVPTYYKNAVDFYNSHKQ